MVATQDVGGLAAEVLQQDWSGTRVVELEGPARISPNDLARLLPYLRTVPLERGAVLHEAGDTIEHVYFPHSGMVSLVAVMRNGATVETVRNRPDKAASDERCFLIVGSPAAGTIRAGAASRSGHRIIYRPIPCIELDAGPIGALGQNGYLRRKTACPLYPQ